MPEDISLNDVNSEFEEKVCTIADEVLTILKELSLENKKQINSKSIAERMVWKESVKSLLSGSNTKARENEMEADCLKEVTDMLLDKFTCLVPSHMADTLGSIKEEIHNNQAAGCSRDWLDSPVKVIKKYIDSLSNRNRELEDFMKQTMDYLANTEVHMTDELSTQQDSFNEDSKFADNISSNMNEIQQGVAQTSDLSQIKMAVMGRIENINKGIEQKRDRDMKRLQDTENTLEEMSKRMSDIKREADEIRKKSEEIEYDAIRDGLTGLYNRKAYDQRLTETLADVNRYEVTISMMICDIDFFKKINDTHGHTIGDLALKKLATLLKERLRINDFISRYGGEEFVILLPHTDLAGGKKAAEGIRSYIDKSSFSYKGEKIPMTISVGVSTFKKGDDSSSVFERADNALYLAKRSGRNAVKTEDEVESNSVNANAVNAN